MAAHPIVGMLVTGHFGAKYCVGLVTRYRFPRKGKNKGALATVRIYGGPSVMDDDDGTWGHVIRRYKGKRFEVPVTSLQTVCLGVGEAWIDANDFFDMKESTDV